MAALTCTEESEEVQSLLSGGDGAALEAEPGGARCGHGHTRRAGVVLEPTAGHYHGLVNCPTPCHSASAKRAE